jgi:Icc-related predicted phosphoesterase
MMGSTKSRVLVGEISSPFIPLPQSRGQGLLSSIAKKIRTLATNAVNTSPSESTTHSKNSISIVCISDTHNTKPSLPHGDILLHAGDLSQYGLFDEIQAQLNWINAQPHRHKIVIAGNHDLVLDEKFVKRHPDRELDKAGKAHGDIQWGDVKYLENSSIEVECNDRVLKIYGSPMTPNCGNFAFQYGDSENFWVETVPEDTDILLTHGPPALYLDEGRGCAHLLKEIWRVRPSLVVFGHIHGGRGEQLLEYDAAQACYENVQLGMRPWMCLLKLLLIIIWQSLTPTSWSARGAPATRLVNAAVITGRGNAQIREPIIIKL